MGHVGVLRWMSFVVALCAFGVSNTAWFYARRMKRSLQALSQLRKDILLDAWRGGLEQAAKAVDALIEHTWLSGADVKTLLLAQAAIQDLIREVKEEGAKHERAGVVSRQGS